MAAAFERARAALDRHPPLSSTVERVLQRCGPRADLLLESAAHVYTLRTEPLFLLVQSGLEHYVSMEMALLSRPLLTALQEGAARCSRCSPLGRLVIQSVMPSGSSVDTLMPLVPAADGVKTGSDIDYMVQLGPVLWEKTDAVCSGSQEAAAGSEATLGPAGAGLGLQDDQTAPRLRVVPTENPGFVLLYQAKEEKCKHQDEHLFSASFLRRGMYLFYKANNARDFDMSESGPATAFITQCDYGVGIDGVDMVPCLRANWWPSEEFFQRSRVRDWPPAAVRDDIRQFGIHLVPVGAKGSSTELHEFRLSFSRPELVAAWHLLPQQRDSLVMLKVCKSALGLEGKPVKSYYMKTALFWLCQDREVKQWTSLRKGMNMIINYLESAIDARYLGCFFWSEINLFRQSSPADLAAMRHTLGLLRRNMTRLMAHKLSLYIELFLAPIIFRESSRRLSECQLRVCLTRELVATAVRQGLHYSMLPMHKNEKHMIQMLLRSSAAAELAGALHTLRCQQSYLFLALTVAPADVMAQCRLTALGDDMFSWDAAPLVALLTYEDLEGLVGDPGAVHVWLQEQRRLPAGLSTPRARADLLLNPSLLAEALCECAPEKLLSLLLAGHMAVQYPESVIPPASYEDAVRQTQQKTDIWQTLAVFESLPRHGNQSVLFQCISFWESERQFLDDPSTRTEYDRLRRSLPDPWKLWQFVFTNSRR